MAGGGLFDPLGTDRTPAGRPALTLSAPVVAAVAAAAVATLLAVAWLRDDGDRGSPRAVSTIDHLAPPPKPAAAPPPATAVPVQTAAPPQPALPAAAGFPGIRDDQEVEIQNGVRIIRPRRALPASRDGTGVVPSPPPPGTR